MCKIAKMVKVAIVGASGYTGAELMRICASHPSFEVVVATARSHEDQRVADVYPSLSKAYGEMRYKATELDLLADLDVVFLALPHGESHRIAGSLLGSAGVIVDLSADFRLLDPRMYPLWYGWEHQSPDLLEEAVYGLPELFRTEVVDARLIAVPGCYPTAAGLALAPFMRAGVIEGTAVIVDALSGLSGAGRSTQESTQFCLAAGGASAYGIGNHRHTPEMEQLIGASVLFAPHLVPMVRGILATCYAPSSGGLSTEEALGVLEDEYRAEPFIEVSERVPATKAVWGSNCAHLSARVDARTGWLVVMCALDNLVKGASGQAVQCANLAMGCSEDDGLASVGVYP